MKLDATDLRYITTEEFRVLTAVEMGSKNHEVVPTPLIAQISGLRNGGVNKLIGSLAKRNLIAKVQNSKYDGYRLTYGGYDYLAMRALSKRDSMHSVGNQIGVGKESDIYIVADSEGKEMVLKLHRLGRISFRTIKQKRDYLGKRKSASWMYMSRLSAQKEWAFMKILHEHGFPVPTPIDQARHCILMEYIDAYPLRQIAKIDAPGKLYSTLMDLIVRLAHAGLIHGDFNEFNILIRDSGEPVLIDFPQMVSTSHENAEWYFNRDVECIRTFFRRRFQYESSLYPRFKKTVSEGPDGQDFRLDVVVSASGFGRKEMRELEAYMDAVKTEEGEDLPRDEGEEEEEEEEEEDGEDEEEQEDAKPERSHSEVRQEKAQGSEEAEQRGRRTSEEANALTQKLSDLNLSPSRRSFSRSPPRSLSRSPPRSRASSLPRSQDSSPSRRKSSKVDVKNIVSDTLSKSRAQQQRKYHSKRSTRHAGRPQGSKAKQDKTVKLDKSGFWD